MKLKSIVKKDANNRKIIFVMMIFSFLMVSFIIGAKMASAAEISSAVKLHYFYSPTCSHCKNVADSGILESVSDLASIEKINVLESQENQQKFLEFAEMFGIERERQGIPFLVIEKNGQYSYLAGDSSIINNLRDSILNFQPAEIKNTSEQLTLGAIILAALIDSINPCAFGVLIFLIIGLLATGSSKRALRAGLIYSFVVFVVYFLIGLGIVRVLPYLFAFSYVFLILGILVLIGALIEIKDFFWYGRGFSLKIPISAKPVIEKLISKGTLPAIILLGIFVSLVEAPCTGGIYVSILSLLVANKAFGIGYLLLYNLIFVLPLVVITFMVYYGAKVESIRTWVENNKRIMRLLAGIIMAVFAVLLIRMGLP